MVWAIETDKPVKVEDFLARYRCYAEKEEIWIQAKRSGTSPELPASFLYEGEFLKYYRKGTSEYCLRPGREAPSVCIEFQGKENRYTCMFREDLYPESYQRLNQIISALPMGMIFLRNRALLLHSSQVLWKGKGIVFTAPSGTGKTTQSYLWQRYRQAERLTNDRTLLYCREGEWRTGSYPLDGSDPVSSLTEALLGCVVLLVQGKENRLERLHKVADFCEFSSQVIAEWESPEVRIQILERLEQIWEKVPLYRLTCLPNEESVNCLARALEKEGW